jgi:ferritin-like metal-binding protein YciE
MTNTRKTAAKKTTPKKTVSRKSPKKQESTLHKFLVAVDKEVKEVFSHTNTNVKTKHSLVQDSKLHEFFIDELRDIYWAEKHIAKTLPKMKKAATSSQLQAAFESHLKATVTHVTRLEQAFAALGEKARGKKCEAIVGITSEGESIIADTDKGTATRDVGLILAAQKVEHYEIATYGGLAQLARTLGQDKVASILEKTLQEEKDTDALLTKIAEATVNYDASIEAA